MEESILSIIKTLCHLIWTGPLLVLVLGVGLLYTIQLRGIQFRYLIYALKISFMPDKETEGKGDISHFQSLMTALAGTVGIGNLAGVATAWVIGGPGALFWMWITAWLGMSMKYAEAFLAQKYRSKDSNGEWIGGPMVFIEKGLGWKKLSVAFAFFGILASFGGGNMIQTHSVADALHAQFQIPPFYTGIIFSICLGLTIVGGIRSIGFVASILVPVMAAIYLAACAYVLFLFADHLPNALYIIFHHAWVGQAFWGGAIGGGIVTALRVGISRGVMTSEAGLGTASIVAAAAKSDTPGRQALVSMTGSFLSTIVMCTVTGLVLGVGFSAADSDSAIHTLNGASLTLWIFQQAFPGGGMMVTFAIVLFGFTTLLGWAYYGEKCLEYLMGLKAIPYFRVLFILICMPAAVWSLELVWTFSDLANGLMALPNLIGIAALAPIVKSDTKAFLASLKKESISSIGSK